MIQNSSLPEGNTPSLSYVDVIRLYPGCIRHMSQGSRDICSARLCLRCFLWELHISTLQHIVRQRRAVRISPSVLP